MQTVTDQGNLIKIISFEPAPIRSDLWGSKDLILN